MSDLVLSLFPGGGLLDYAFEQEGYCIVRGPDVIWGGDIRRFHPPAGVFDGIIGGPPCPAHSRLRHQIEASGNEAAADLVGELVRVIGAAAPTWWIMENAPKCYVPAVPGYEVHSQVFDNHSLGELQSRRRLICFGTRDGRRLHIDTPALVPIEREQAVTRDARAVPVAIGGSGKRKPGADKPPRSIEDRLELQGMPRDWLVGQPWTKAAQAVIVGNGVPLPMGRAIARAIRTSMQHPTEEPTCDKQHSEQS